METITLSDLIRLVEEGQPPHIIVGDKEYEYEEGDYYCLDSYGTLFGSYTLAELTNYRLKIKIKEEPILTDEEKEYLSNVIKPFRDEIEFISKTEGYNDEHYEFIFIVYSNPNIRDTDFPLFKFGKYYKNMKLFHRYTLEELGL